MTASFPAGSWSISTPLGELELDVEADGSYRMRGPTGRLVEQSGKIFAEPADGIRSEVPAAHERWWWGLGGGGGALGWHLRQVSRRGVVTTAAGAHLPLPDGWASSPAPRAWTLYPTAARRPGLPPSSFVEVHESLIPELPDDALLEAVGRLLTERTVGGAVRVLAPVDVDGRRVLRCGATAAMPTGESYDATLWLFRVGAYLLTLAQTNLRDEPLVSDEAVVSLLSQVSVPDLEQDADSCGEWHCVSNRQRDRWTERTTEHLLLDSDGGMRRRVETVLVDGDRVSRPVEEPAWTYGFWAVAPGRLVLSHLWQGCEAETWVTDGADRLWGGRRFVRGQGESSAAG